jgi:DNA-binding winged helix-turn-helix (wHTH) protein
MSHSASHCYEFGPFYLNPFEQLLLRDGEAVLLPPKVFAVLLLLVQNHGHLMLKEAMLRAVWPDCFVEEGSLTHYISVLRQILGEWRNGEQYILTVPKRGYRFVAHVKEARGRSAYSVKSSALGRAVRSIAVLPFKPLIAANRDEALELGLADALITRLGSQQILVRPTSAIRKYTQLEQDSLAAGRDLQVEAVLEGHMQWSGQNIRVTARLLRVRDNMTLWADQFDEQFIDSFKVQDAISARVVETLVEKLRGKES